MKNYEYANFYALLINVLVPICINLILKIRFLV